MNNHLNKLIISALLLLFSFSSHAQEIDSLYMDSTNEYSTVQMLDSVFKHVDLSQVPTGILIDKALITANITDFNGTLHDSNVCSTFLWRRLWASLYRAHVDTNISKDTLDLFNLVDTLQGYLNAGLMPITLLNYNYSKIKSSAFEDSLLYMDGVELFDVPGRTQSPYETVNCIAASAASITADSLKIHYIIPSQFYYTNDTIAIDTIQIDFGDGMGYRTVNFDEEIIVEYDTTGTVEFAIRIKFVDNIEKFVKGVIDLFDGPKQPLYDEYMIKVSEKTFRPDPEKSDLGKGAAHVSIHYQCSNSEKKLLRPFIVVGGYGPPYASYGNPGYNGPMYGKEYFSDFIGEYSKSTMEEIISQQYDLVFVEFLKPDDYMQRNAYALEEVIKWVNEEKAANGSKAPNVVLGHSMGGIVARYALGDMHKDYLDNPTTVADHDVRLFYTHDSPHLGANIPIGTQTLVKMLMTYYVNINNLSIIEWEDLYWSYRNLTSRSGRQMLIHDVYAPNTPNEHSDFYDDLETIAPFEAESLGCKSILICDGSGAGIPQGKGLYGDPSWNSTDPGDRILKCNKYLSKGVNFRFDIYATPDGTGSKMVFEGGFSNSINGQYYKRYTVTGEAYSNMTTSIDGSPGSRASASKLGIDKLQRAFENYFGPNYANIPVSFIPSVSSTAFDGFITYSDIINGSAISGIHKFFLTRDDMTSLPSYVSDFRNGSHAQYTPHSAEFLKQDFLKMVPETLATGNWFNYGPPVSDRIGTTLIEDEATLHINSDEDIGLYNTDIRYTTNPAAGSTYTVETKQFNNCDAEPSTITVEGNLELGDDVNTLSGELVIRAHSKLILKNGSNVTLHNSSKLIIDEHAELEIEDGVTFNLIDANSEVVIRGILTMQSNADITLATGDGNWRFDCPDNAYCSTQFVGNNTISLMGAGRTDKVLVVTGKGLDLTGLATFNVTTGKVELGTNTEIVVDGSIELNTVKVTKATGVAGTHVHKGIVINSLTGKTISIQHSRFEYGQIGLTKSATSNISPLSLTETTFGYCAAGLKTVGGSCTLSKVRFDNCVTGWDAADMTAASEFMGFAENNMFAAINYEGNSSAHLYVYESTFKENNEDNQAAAIIGNGGFDLTVGCTHFIDNAYDIMMAQGNLLLSSGNGGDNYFNNTLLNTLTLDNAASLDLSGGNNTFIYAANPIKVITGTINSGITTLMIDGNYWETFDVSGSPSFLINDLYTDLEDLENNSSASITCVTATVLTTEDICDATWNGVNEVTEKIARLPKKKPAVHQAAVQLYKLYPNPASNTLYLKATIGAAENNLTVKAIDLMGKTILLQGKSELDISQLAVGMYQIIVEQNGHILHKQKLVVNR